VKEKLALCKKILYINKYAYWTKEKPTSKDFALTAKHM